MDQSVLYHWHEDFREEAKVLAEVLTVDPSQASALFLSCICMWERALFRTWLKLFLHAFMCGDVSTTWVRGDVFVIESFVRSRELFRTWWVLGSFVRAGTYLGLQSLMIFDFCGSCLWKFSLEVFVGTCHWKRDLEFVVGSCWWEV